jgi:hypothetical protein
MAAGDLGLAGRLSTDVERRFPYHRHALAACSAMLEEAHGHPAQAARAHADAAAGWERFGVVPERAHALLGQARCLVAVADPSGAAVAEEARAIFEHLGATPAVAAAVSLEAQTVEP